MIKQELDSNDEDDPVVSEIPIYHSTRLQGNLYVLEHKNELTSCLARNNVSNVYFRPANQEMKFKTLNDNSEDEECEIVHSQKKCTTPENIVIAAFTGKEVHLSSVKNVFCFGVDYDKIEKKKDGESSDDDEVPSASRITVKFKNPRLNQIKTVTSNPEIENEKWVECEIAPKGTPTSNSENMKLLTDYLHETCQSNNLDEKTYFKHLVPDDLEQHADESSLPSHMLSLNALKALPLLEQCRLLLKGTQIIQFQQILLMLAGSSGLTTESLLKTLPNIAVLVRGNWVVKSEVLYPPDTLSTICGVPSDNMCRARDYMLYLFTKNQYVQLKKVVSVVKVPAEEIKEIFKGVSSLRHNKGWELNLGTDSDFIEKYPDLEQRQTLLWEQRYIQVSDFLKGKNRRKSRSESKSISEDKKSGQCNSSDNESSVEKTKAPLHKKKRTK